MYSKLVKVKCGDGMVVDCKLRIPANSPWQVELLGVDSGVLRASGSDLFKALSALREQLEDAGMILLINGSRSDVICSGMSRSMGGGRQAYKARLGEPARADQLVDIFEYANEELISSVAEQRSFYEQWVESLDERV